MGPTRKSDRHYHNHDNDIGTQRPESGSIPSGWQYPPHLRGRMVPAFVAKEAFYLFSVIVVQIHKSPHNACGKMVAVAYRTLQMIRTIMIAIDSTLRRREFTYVPISSWSFRSMRRNSMAAGMNTVATT